MQALREDDPVSVAEYRLLGRLGEGGMGVVYLARSRRGRMVAVKSVRPELAALPDFRLRFAEEVSIAQRVGGDWTAAVLDADPQAARPWVATAYVPGPTLTEVVTRHGPLPERSVRGLASGLCDALADIHAAGLVHRDLKPSNVMITIEGPKVIDFGIVRALDGPTHGGLTSSSVVVGSPGFMAPEQVRGERLTAACDIFSLGSVLAFAACGRLPFEAPEGRPHALMYRVVHEEPDLTTVPDPLVPLIRDCLSKDPADRPALAALRARDETQFRHLGPWLPAPVLARLGQDAAQLLEYEDPGTAVPLRAVPPPAPPPPEEAPTVDHHRPRTPATAPLTVANPPKPSPRVRRQTPAPRRTLAEERRSYGDPGRSALAVYVLLALFALTALGHSIVQLLLQDEYYDHTFGVAFEVAYPWGILQFTTGVGLTVAWLVWFSRVRALAERFAPGRLRHSRAMAVRSWFIPFGNLYLPKQIADDVWHASSPPSPDGAMAPAARLHIWWGFWVVSALTSPVFWYWGAFEWATDDFFARETIGSDDYYVYYLDVFGLIIMWVRLLAVPAAVATALYVSRLTAMQRARQGRPSGAHLG
ncbi:DUF4328 domain-containing protein [Streptomyces sp. NPDC033538]|uniref:protein kinase domain-containing protein n=1 Tax=Streptomyces sp. NPDC033538 TaxID=3155367 RepID=UPI0033C8BA92